MLWFREFFIGVARYVRSYLGKGNHMSERITGHTELIGLMAYPIRHSSSPAMQNEAFAKLGYDYAYLAFEVDANEIEAVFRPFVHLRCEEPISLCPTKH